MTLVALKALLDFISKIHNVMVLRATLIVKVNWKRKTCSLHCHFFKNKANLMEVTTSVIYYFFL